MPVRLVCPSCSATLSVKDEYAGRAVKCPKCGGVIPASQPGAAPPPAAPKPATALPPPPPPEPEPVPEPAAESPFGALDEPAKPKGKITGRPTGKPLSKGGDDDEDTKPARRKGRDDDDRNRDDEKGARRKGRDDDESDEDRPSRNKRKRGDDDEDGDRPEKKKGGGGVMIVAIICGTLLLCCGGGGFGAYWFVIKPVKEGAQKLKDDIVEAAEKWNPKVNTYSYGKLEVGETTRTQTDSELGTGRIATDADLAKVFASDPSRSGEWNSMVSAKRAIVWQNGDDYVIAAFNPTADGASRLQMKEWRPKSGAALKEGELNDAKFATAYPPGGGPGIPVTAEELAQAYKNGTAAADTKYKKKVLLVEGVVDDIDSTYSASGPREWRAKLKGVKKAGGGDMEVHVMMSAADGTKLLAASRGQTVKLKGKCKGYDNFSAVELTNGTFDSSSPDQAPTVSATELINDFAKDSTVADEKYSGKPITITNAVVERKEGDSTLYLTATGKKGGPTRIKAEFNQFDDSLKKQVADARVGGTVKIKGDFRNFSGNTITIGRAYIAP